MTPGPVALGLAARHLRAGGVVAHATEGVWGFAADPLNAAAVARVLLLKVRDVGKGLILVADSAAHFAPLLDALPAERAAEVRASWPGPHTWVVPDPQHDWPDWVSGGRDSVALRVTAHPGTRALCAAFGGPLVSTSANPAQRPPAQDALTVRRWFGAALAGGELLMLPGPTGGASGPSSIRDARSGALLRGAGG